MTDNFVPGTSDGSRWWECSECHHEAYGAVRPECPKDHGLMDEQKASR